MVAIGSVIAAAQSHAAASAQTDASIGLEEIVVTATRKSESLSKVPLSISAFNQEMLDQRGVRDFADVVRSVPGVVVDATNTTTNISIRGINSTAGAATTGIYIDDTPIQIRALGYSGGNTYPVIFDLERVEVLRGPQGTLFGAGSEGGTIRFISPQPSLESTSGYARTEYAVTKNGGASREVGFAYGTPLVTDVLGVRVSGYYRHDGGYLDRVRFEDKSVVDTNANWNDSYVGKVAFTWQAAPGLKITPSIAYQKININDSPESWDNLRSDPSVPDAAFSNYSAGKYLNGNRVQESGTDKFTMPAVNVQYDFTRMRLVAIASYFDREQTFLSDYTLFDQSLFTGITLPIFPEQAAVSNFLNTQKSLTGEVRLQSTEESSAVSWVVGAFYQQAKQVSIQQVHDQWLFQYAPFLIPFFPPLVNGDQIYDQATSSRDTQTAVYGQVNFKASDRLTLTAGMRYGQTKFDINSFAQGPVVGPPVTDLGTQKEKPFTPKLGLNFQASADTLLYASVAKGFRPGGYNPQIGVGCGPELDAIGYPNGRPTLYGSDTVMSYEVGAKSKALGGRLGFQASAYHIDWTDIQQVVGVNSCGFQFTANLGKAHSDGADLQVDFRATKDLSLQGEFGLNNATFQSTFLGGPTATLPLVSKGDHVASPPWTASLHAQYDLSIKDNHDAYIRSDFDYRPKQTSLTPFLNPANGGTDLTLSNPPTIEALSLRAGYRVRGVDLSVFANNVLNQHVWAGRHARDNLGSTIYKSYMVRPLTIGVTASYRF
jgi:hypothetical protein